MRKDLYLAMACSAFLLISCAGGGGSGAAGGGGVSSPGVHNIKECPQLAGQYRMQDDPEVKALVELDEQGRLVFKINSEKPLVVDGQLHTIGNSTAIAICSSNTVIVSGKTGGRDENAVVRPTPQGFLIELNKGEEKLEYIRE